MWQALPGEKGTCSGCGQPSWTAYCDGCCRVEPRHYPSGAEPIRAKDALRWEDIAGVRGMSHRIIRATKPSLHPERLQS